MLCIDGWGAAWLTVKEWSHWIHLDADMSMFHGMTGERGRGGTMICGDPEENRRASCGSKVDDEVSAIPERRKGEGMRERERVITT